MQRTEEQVLHSRILYLILAHHDLHSNQLWSDSKYHLVWPPKQQQQQKNQTASLLHFYIVQEEMKIKKSFYNCIKYI